MLIYIMNKLMCVCLCVCAYIYIHIHTWCAYIYIHIHTWTHHTHTHTHTLARARTQKVSDQQSDDQRGYGVWRLTLTRPKSKNSFYRQQLERRLWEKNCFLTADANVSNCFPQETESSRGWCNTRTTKESLIEKLRCLRSRPLANLMCASIWYWVSFAP